MRKSRFTMKALFQGILIVCLLTCFYVAPVASVTFHEENVLNLRDYLCSPATIKVPANAQLYGLQVEKGAECPPDSDIITNPSIAKDQVSPEDSTLYVPSGSWCFVSIAVEDINSENYGYFSDEIDGFLPSLITQLTSPEVCDEDEDIWGPYPYEQDRTGYCPNGHVLLGGSCLPLAGSAALGCEPPWIDNPNGEGCVNPDAGVAPTYCQPGYELGPNGGCFDPEGTIHKGTICGPTQELRDGECFDTINTRGLTNCAVLNQPGSTDDYRYEGGICVNKDPAAINTNP